jgi:hypothetical protein
MKVSTNYTVHANISHINYFSGDESFTFYTTDDEHIEIYGADLGEVLCFARNFLVVDLKRTDRVKLCEHQVNRLNEIKDALTEYLKEE